MDDERDEELDSTENDSTENDSTENESSENESNEAETNANDDVASDVAPDGTSVEGEIAADSDDAGDSGESEPDEAHEEFDEDELDGLSLDDLGAAYARVAAEHDPEAFAPPDAEETEGEVDSDEADDEEDLGEDDEVDDIVTPEAIVEAALFVGHPDNKSMSEQRLASLMRDVSPEEIVELIEHLNDSYRESDQALRIIRDDHGYRMTVAPEVEGVRRSFLGKVRETRLSQTAIEVLALVAYQPGVTSQKVQDQRGRESASLLNQLVRRQLLRMDRVKPEDGGRAVPHYYPTERFLVLFGLDSIEDLPHVEEGLRED